MLRLVLSASPRNCLFLSRRETRLKQPQSNRRNSFSKSCMHTPHDCSSRTRMHLSWSKFEQFAYLESYLPLRPPTQASSLILTQNHIIQELTLLAGLSRQKPFRVSPSPSPQSISVVPMPTCSSSRSSSR